MRLEIANGLFQVPLHTVCGEFGLVIANSIQNGAVPAYGMLNANITKRCFHRTLQSKMAAIDVLQNPGQVDPARFGEHFSSVAEEIRPAYEKVRKELKLQGPISDPAFVDDVTRAHIIQAVDRLTRLSGTIEELVSSERIAIVAVMYDVRSGTIEVVHATSASMQTA